MISEHKKILIHTLTPLFIGSGEEFSPLTFWIDTSKNELVEFSEKTFVDTLSSEEKSQLGNSDLLAFMRRINKYRPEGKHIPVTSAIVDTYQKVLNGDQKEFNNFAIKKLITNPNSNLPYIAGSSLKGVFRTGYLAECDGLTKIKEKKEWNVNEGAVLGRMSADIFSALKVGDAEPVGDVNTKIFYAQRCRKKCIGGSPKNSVTTMLHAIMGGNTFAGEITLVRLLNTPKRLAGITDVLERAEKYAISLLNDADIGIKYPAVDELQKIKDDFTNPVYLCRLGGLIGAESHTINGFRDIKIRNPKKKDDYRPYSTQTICASLDKNHPTNISFGWCLIEMLDTPASQNLPHLRSFIQEQEKVLQEDLSYKQRSFVYANRPVGVVSPRTSFDRNGVYTAKVVRLGKKGKAMMQLEGKEFTLLDEGVFEIGQTLEITQIQGTTCKLKK